MPKRKSASNCVDGGKKMKQATLDGDGGGGGGRSSAIQGTWHQTPSLLTFSCPDAKASSKILALDMDSTIIETASGKVFAVDMNDWKIISSQVSSVLKSYVAKGYKIVIISNQAALDKNPITLVPQFQQKMLRVFAQMGVPVQGFFALKSDLNRKPRTGMWKALEENNDGIEIDKAASIYCGDAAGRQASGKIKKDHSHCDRLFAVNVGVPFKTPEELWGIADYQPRPEYSLSFDPKAARESNTPNFQFEPPKSLELVMMVGLPASGKSSICRLFLEKLGYKVVSRDILKTPARCLSVAEAHLSKGESVVVDNTNLDVQSRSPYIELAKTYKATRRAYVMSIAPEHALHNEVFRQITAEKHDRISSMVFNMMKKKYKEPTLDEGIDSIVFIPFVFKAASDAQEALYFQYLLEK